MSQFIKSLYRLYKRKQITKQMLDQLLTSKKINQQEYDYITSAEML